MSQRNALAAMRLAGAQNPVAHLLPEMAVWRCQWREFLYFPDHLCRSSTPLLLASGNLIERPLRGVVLQLMLDAVELFPDCLEIVRNVAVSLGHFDVFAELAPVASKLARIMLDCSLLHHDAPLELNVIYHFSNGLASLHPRIKKVVGECAISRVRLTCVC
jgi:hypothetical protein